MKTLLLILISIVLTRLSFAECDCTIYPFKPPSCAQECMVRMSKGDYSQLTNLFALPPSISRKIVNFPERDKATSLASYRPVLSSKEIATVEYTFSKVSKDAVAAFFKEEKQKKINPR